MSRETILIRLQQEYADRRAENLRRFILNQEKACEHCPGLSELLDARSNILLSGIRQCLGPHREGENRSESIAALNRQISETMEKHGVPHSLIEPVYICSLCKDEGYLYDPSRRMCSCMAEELRTRLLRENGISGNLHTFADFDPSCYSEEEDSRGYSPRQIAVANLHTCQVYADNYPDTGVLDLLISGRSGLGKTFILECIASRIAERGYTPLTISAYKLLEAARQAYIDNDDTPFMPYLNAELLLVDDLGTEPLLNNITVTQLFRLINERRIRGLHTVFTTNLTMSQLQERYTERITSRFSDLSACRRMMFTGDDVRMLLGRKKEQQ